MRITPLISAALVAMLLLSGCGGDDESSPTPTPGTSDSADQTASASPSPKPTIAAADGPALDGEVSSVRVPQGWKARDNGMPWTKIGSDDQTPGRQSVSLLEGPWGDPSPLDAMAKRAADDFDRAPKRLPDVTLDGETAYRLQGVSTGVSTDEIGLTSHDKWIQLSILSQGLTAAQREELVASVVASFQWKS